LWGQSNNPDPDLRKPENPDRRTLNFDPDLEKNQSNPDLRKKPINPDLEKPVKPDR